jgi:hypothetical protein
MQSSTLNLIQEQCLELKTQVVVTMRPTAKGKMLPQFASKKKSTSHIWIFFWEEK